MMHRMFSPTGILSAALALLFMLWLPGLQIPIISDPAHYALLGHNLWTTGHYEMFGEPHARFLPLLPVVSYPIVLLFGFSDGMKVTSLIFAIGSVIATYLLISRTFDRRIAAWTSLLLATHHGFVYIATTGSADTLFSFLFLLSAWAFLKAEDDRRFYVFAGILAGLSCLTRYNGAPLFLLFPFWVLWKRRGDFFTPTFLGGMAAGGSLFALWFMRNFLVFGDPFHSEYVEYASDQCPDLIAQFFSNLLYYANPIHNIMPILLVTCLWGMIRSWRSQWFLLFLLGAAELLTAGWCVQGMRFALPGYPILLGFAVFGLFDVAGYFRTFRKPFLITAAAGIIMGHSVVFLLYTYGITNAWWDRTIGIIPPSLGISSEALYAREEGRRYINEHAESGAWILVPEDVLVTVWREGVFREDLRVTTNPSDCPQYVILQGGPFDGEVFVSESQPRTAVIKEECLQ